MTRLRGNGTGTPRHRNRVTAGLAAGALLLAACTPGGTGGTGGTDDAPPGAVGVQLFQWTWDAIAAECQGFLGPAGYDYVLTSPPQEHILGEPWWTAYQPVSHQVESRLGTREEFAAMVATCDEAGVGIVADAVINHMTGQDTPGVGWAGSSFEHYEYPALYSDADGDFHHCGLVPNDDIANYGDRAQVQDCELLNLADLATEKDSVRDTIVAYLEDLLSLGVAGLRIDAAKHMPAGDVAAITRRLPEGTLIWSEVIRGAGEPIQPEEYTDAGDVFEFGYGTQLKTVMNTATPGQLEPLATGTGLLPHDKAVVFVDNHDTERNGTTLSYRDDVEYALANVLMLAAPYGLPVVYSGYAFPQLDGHDLGPAQDAEGAVTDAACADDAGPEVRVAPQEWVCAHRWPQIAPMVELRSAVGDAQITNWQADGRVLGFGRGEAGFVLVNLGREPVSGAWATSMPPGEYCDVQTGGHDGTACLGTVVEVGEDGAIEVEVPSMGAVAIHVGAGSGGSSAG